MLSFRLRNIKTQDESLNGLMAFTAEILAIFRLTVNPKCNVVVIKVFFRIKHHQIVLIK